MTAISPDQLKHFVETAALVYKEQVDSKIYKGYVQIKTLGTGKVLNIYVRVLTGDACEHELSHGLYIAYADYRDDPLVQQFYTQIRQRECIRISGPELADLVTAQALQVLELGKVYDQFINKDASLTKAHFWTFLDGILRRNLNQFLNDLPPNFHGYFALNDGRYRLESALAISCDDQSGVPAKIPPLKTRLQILAAKLQKYFKSQKFHHDVNELKRAAQLEQNFQPIDIGEPFSAESQPTPGIDTTKKQLEFTNLVDVGNTLLEALKKDVEAVSNRFSVITQELAKTAKEPYSDFVRGIAALNRSLCLIQAEILVKQPLESNELVLETTQEYDKAIATARKFINEVKSIELEFLDFYKNFINLTKENPISISEDTNVQKLKVYYSGRLEIFSKSVNAKNKLITDVHKLLEETNSTAKETFVGMAIPESIESQITAVKTKLLPIKFSQLIEDNVAENLVQIGMETNQIQREIDELEKLISTLEMIRTSEIPSQKQIIDKRDSKLATKPAPEPEAAPSPAPIRAKQREQIIHLDDKRNDRRSFKRDDSQEPTGSSYFQFASSQAKQAQSVELPKQMQLSLKKVFGEKDFEAAKHILSELIKSELIKSEISSQSKDKYTPNYSVPHVAKSKLVEDKSLSELEIALIRQSLEALKIKKSNLK